MKKLMICSYFKAIQGIPVSSSTEFNIIFTTCVRDHSLQAAMAVEICKTIFW